MELAEKESILELLLEALASGLGPDPKVVLDKDDVDPVLATAQAITGHVDATLKLAEERDRTTSLRYVSLTSSWFIIKGFQVRLFSPTDGLVQCSAI